MYRQLLSLLFILTFLISCGGGNGTPATGPDFDDITAGTLKVSVTTGGDSKDEDGYTFTVDADMAEKADTSGIVYFKLEQGSHEVEISGIASNCALQGDNPDPFKIIAGDTTSVGFKIECGLVLKNKIVYSGGDGNEGLYVISPDGSNFKQLTTLVDAMPTISPNGQRILFANFSPSAGANIMVIDADGSNRKRLTFSASYSHNVGAKWSPDGSKIVFVSDRDGDLEIFTMNADGTGLTQLTNNNETDFFPDWSPDGSRIVFTSERNGASEADLYIMDIDGNNVELLLKDLGFKSHPSWSPDGSKIAFANSTADGGGREIFVMNADGTNIRRITNNPAIDDHPAWSPEGSRLVFVSDRTGNREIFVMSLDGSGPIINLSNNLKIDREPDWSPIQ